MIDLNQLERDGFAIMKPFLSADEVGAFIAVTESSTKPSASRGGTRDVADSVSEIASLARHPTVQSMVGQVLGSNAFVVRATLFDKTGTSNWKVPWHQDVTIAVDSRRDVKGYGPWSVKAGIVHVQPPTCVLETNLSSPDFASHSALNL